MMDGWSNDHGYDNHQRNPFVCTRKIAKIKLDQNRSAIHPKSFTKSPNVAIFLVKRVSE